MDMSGIQNASHSSSAQARLDCLGCHHILFTAAAPLTHPPIVAPNVMESLRLPSSSEKFGPGAFRLAVLCKVSAKVGLKSLHLKTCFAISSNEKCRSLRIALLCVSGIMVNGSSPHSRVKTLAKMAHLHLESHLLEFQLAALEEAPAAVDAAATEVTRLLKRSSIARYRFTMA